MNSILGRTVGALAIAVFAFALTSCDSLDSSVTRVKEQVTGNYPTRTQNFAGAPRAVYAAARQTLKAMEYRFEKGGPAEGFLDALSRPLPGDDPTTWRQFGVHAEFHASLDRKSTDVVVSMTETEAPDQPGIANRSGTQVPLRDTSLYDVFFRGIQEALDQPDTKPAGIAAPIEGH
ncbi:MAG TPA: hypothetical protein VGL42_17735 [Opitutaceae bacterium]|jgi:hypothetical protein